MVLYLSQVLSKFDGPKQRSETNEISLDIQICNCLKLFQDFVHYIMVCQQVFQILSYFMNIDLLCLATVIGRNWQELVFRVVFLVLKLLFI